MNHQQTNQSKRRFNVIDIVILLALLVVMAFAGNYIANDMFSKNLAEVEYYLRLEGVREDDINRLSLGQPISANSPGTTLGTICEILPVASAKAVFNAESGRFVYADIPGKFTVYLRINAVCTFKNHHYQIGDYRISAGTCPDILLPLSLESAEIVAVQPVNHKTGDTSTTDSSREADIEAAANHEERGRL